MSNMESLDMQLSEKERQNEVYQTALRRIEAEKRSAAAAGYAVVSAVVNYGQGTSSGAFGKVSHGAKLFCIGFAFLVPSLLVWRVLL